MRTSTTTQMAMTPTKRCRLGANRMSPWWSRPQDILRNRAGVGPRPDRPVHRPMRIDAGLTL